MGLPLYQPPEPQANIAMAMKLLEWAHPGSRAKVLDIGCGDGDATAAIAARVRRVIGVEWQFTAIRKCRNNHPGIEIIEHDCRHLNALPRICRGRFDRVYAVDAIHHILRDETTRANVLNGCFRALKPGGLLVCDFPDQDSEHLLRLAVEATSSCDGGVVSSHFATYCWCPRLEWMEELVKANGFEWVQEATDQRIMKVGGRDGRSGKLMDLDRAVRKYVMKYKAGLLADFPCELHYDMIEDVVRSLRQEAHRQNNADGSFRDTVITHRFIARKPLR